MPKYVVVSGQSSGRSKRPSKGVGIVAGIAAVLAGVATLGVYYEKEGVIHTSILDSREDDSFRTGRLPCDLEEIVPYTDQSRNSLRDVVRACSGGWLPIGKISLDAPGESQQRFFDVGVDVDGVAISAPENVVAETESGETIEGYSPASFIFELVATLPPGTNVAGAMYENNVDRDGVLDGGMFDLILANDLNGCVALQQRVDDLEGQISEELDQALQGRPEVEVVISSRNPSICSGVASDG